MNRQEIINELNELIHDSPVRFPVEAMTGLKDALAYIENDRPRVIKIEEIADHVKGPVYFENRYCHGWRILADFEDDRIRLASYDIDSARYLDNYGIAFRLWNRKPTDEQRKATPWEV